MSINKVLDIISFKWDLNVNRIKRAHAQMILYFYTDQRCAEFSHTQLYHAHTVLNEML